MIHLRRLFKSFTYALRGLRIVLASEQSFRVQALAAIVVIVLGYTLGVSAFEWIILLLLVGAVLILELVNSILERIVDAFKPRIHPVVRDVKDAMAGTVLIASTVAAGIGAIIFLPYLLVFVG